MHKTKQGSLVPIISLQGPNKCALVPTVSMQGTTKDVINPYYVSGS